MFALILKFALKHGYLLTYLLRAKMWRIRFAQTIASSLYIGLSLLLRSMPAQQPSILPLFVYMPPFPLPSGVEVIVASAGRSLLQKHPSHVYLLLFRMMEMFSCFFVWHRSLVLELVLGKHTCSIFLKQVSR